MGSDDFISRSILGRVARKGFSAKKTVVAPPIRPGSKKHGKRVVFVTPHFNSAREEKEKHEKNGFRVEIKKEPDDKGRVVYVVYVFE